ncbi:phage holin family protein [Brevibacillus sp. AG]|uniref:phage holin family protein n=1 Tax=Brevibacillus sp. AG TaxID=3020891 RepID=UPI00232F775B|nr:phage holin family protein [Brevibacillus sp. AG]MDC0763483.1 phage holin family protein [Brevibacillus sp. AG]
MDFVARNDGWLTIASGGVIAVITYLFGGLDKLLVAFGIFLILDYGTGLGAAIYRRELSSRVALAGIGRKVAMLVFIIVANQLDLISGNTQGFIRNAILLFLIGTEGISILENCNKLGLPVPPFLSNTLDRLKNRESEKGGKIE